jgi:drug/metabolite transporter (DMT)-like permease
MRLFLLTSLTMVAFAMNSVLNRAAVDGGHADPAGFALVRVASGVVVLLAIVYARGNRPDLRTPRRWGGAVALVVYMIGFSLAYLDLDAGLGALILFGTVQIVLFLHAAMTGASPTGKQIAGALVAFAGLVLALWPTGGAGGALSGALFMVAAGVGWAAYTIAGRGSKNPVTVTATHFLLCLPMLAILLIGFDPDLTAAGWALAIASGGVTSGLGYALWYYVLPDLPGASAAIVQLSVPVIAILLGALLLAEPIGLRVVLSAALVLGGIALALTRRSARAGRR